MREFTVTVVRTMRACMPADTEAEAIRKVEDAARRGKYDAKIYSLYWEDRPPLIFAVPWRSDAEDVVEGLERLTEVEAARHDPKADAAQRLRAARELAAVAMRIIQRETAGANHPEVIRAAELAFHRAKMIARLLWDQRHAEHPYDPNQK